MLDFLRWRVLLVFVVAFALAQGSMNAQSQKAKITGHVSDASQAAIQNAKVVVTPGTLVTTSDELGDFVLSGLAPGNYTVTVTSVGFKPLVQTVTVTDGQSQTLDFA